MVESVVGGRFVVACQTTWTETFDCSALVTCSNSCEILEDVGEHLEDGDVH